MRYVPCEVMCSPKLETSKNTCGLCVRCAHLDLTVETRHVHYVLNILFLDCLFPNIHCLVMFSLLKGFFVHLVKNWKIKIEARVLQNDWQGLKSETGLSKDR